jgi:hypothetical protein
VDDECPFRRHRCLHRAALRHSARHSALATSAGHHLDAESRDVIKLATVVVGTLSALALGLLIASAKTTFENANSELRTSAARVVLLDRVMARYGPEPNSARALLRTLVKARLQSAWQGGMSTPGADEGQTSIEPVQVELRVLMPKTKVQEWLQARALQVSGDIAEAHWLLAETVDEGYCHINLDNRAKSDG